jgi:hypothetical protein
MNRAELLAISPSSTKAARLVIGDVMVGVLTGFSNLLKGYGMDVALLQTAFA